MVQGKTAAGWLPILARVAILAGLLVPAFLLAPTMAVTARAQAPAAGAPAAAQPATPEQAAAASPQDQLPRIAGVDVRAALSARGSFVQHPRYGEVWVPTAVPQGWHPYPPCHWVNTQAYGWYFDDPTPWGSIVHHYGRWIHDDQLGWSWVPTPEFSPGWVVWRTGEQWVGWAPVPPDADIQTVSTEQFANAGSWTFVAIAKLDKGCDGSVAPAAEIPALLQRTQFATQVASSGGIMIIVLPRQITAEPGSRAVAFDPWPVWFFTKVVFDWNWIWTHVSVAVHVVNSCPPAPR